LTLEAEVGAKHIFLLLERLKSAVKYRSIKTRKKLFSRESLQEEVIAIEVEYEQDYDDMGSQLIQTEAHLDFNLIDITCQTH
jgi:hypothetical protein